MGEPHSLNPHEYMPSVLQSPYCPACFHQFQRKRGARGPSFAFNDILWRSMLPHGHRFLSNNVCDGSGSLCDTGIDYGRNRIKNTFYFNPFYSDIRLWRRYLRSR